jgi:DNA-binding NtrC family response regulator
MDRTGEKSQPLIYLVDDEPLLLDLAEVALKHDGYALKKFSDPDAALKSFLKARAKPALLLSDYAMGKMNGLQLIEQCKRAQPELKTILVSGTAGAEIVLSAPVKVDHFLTKPYQATALAEAVRGLLGSKRKGASGEKSGSARMPGQQAESTRG